MPQRSHISIVDDDESVRESLPELLKEEGFAVRAFASAEAFLAANVIATTSCLILDVGLPGLSGPDLKRELDRRGQAMRVIFITARQDDAIRAELLGLGPVACLFKPFTDTALLAAVDDAIRANQGGDHGM